MGRLFLRVFLWFWLGTTSVAIVLAVSFVLSRPDIVATWRFMGRTAMRSLGERVAISYEAQGQEAAASLLASVSRDARFRIWLYTADGQLVGGPSAIEGADGIIRAALATDDDDAAASLDTLLARRATSDSGQQYVIVWDAPLWLRSQVSPWRLSGRLLAVVLTGGLVCVLLTWQITKPIQALRGAARRFADGDLSVRVGHVPELQRRDALQELGREFDRMAGRIQELVASQQELLANISHELRSPLARLSMALDLVQHRLGDIPEHERMTREIRRLDELIDQLLTLARLKGRTDPVRFEPVDLEALVVDVVQDARFEAHASGRTVTIERQCAAQVHGNRSLLRSAIENVVRNAIHHTPEHSTVRVAMAIELEQRQIAILARDEGRGVSSTVLDRLFDPFFRAEQTGDRASAGVGLGLAITREAMLAHGGTARAENHPDGGLLVRLELPIGDTSA